MSLKNQYLSALVILLTALNAPVQAEQPDLKPFRAGSYQQILANNAYQPFILVLWSIACSSCLNPSLTINFKTSLISID
jgi:hypothetical protein